MRGVLVALSSGLRVLRCMPNAPVLLCRFLYLIRNVANTSYCYTWDARFGMRMYSLACVNAWLRSCRTNDCG